MIAEEGIIGGRGKRKGKRDSFQSLWLKQKQGEVNQWHVTAHRCFKTSFTLHLHFRVIIPFAFHWELLQKMTSNICSTLAVIEMPAIIHCRTSYSAFYLPWLSLNDRALWGSEHMSVCFRRIYWNCSNYCVWQVSLY